MFCCLGTTRKSELKGKTTELRRTKVCLSLAPELQFELDEGCSWTFVGQQIRKSEDE